MRRRRVSHGKIVLAAVLERPGWTLSLVRRFLGEPDELQVNRLFPKTPFRLYDLERVKAVERMDAFTLEAMRLAERRLTRKFTLLPALF